MKTLLALLFGFGLYKLGKPSKQKGSGRERQASFEGREYTVFSEGGGAFLVISNADPNTWVEFDDTGEINKLGTEQALNVLRTDMQHFPKDLFS